MSYNLSYAQIYGGESGIVTIKVHEMYRVRRYSVRLSSMHIGKHFLRLALAELSEEEAYTAYVVGVRLRRHRIQEAYDKWDMSAQGLDLIQQLTKENV